MKNPSGTSVNTRTSASVQCSGNLPVPPDPLHRSASRTGRVAAGVGLDEAVHDLHLPADALGRVGIPSADGALSAAVVTLHDRSALASLTALRRAGAEFETWSQFLFASDLF